MSQDRLDTLASSKSAGFSLTELLVVIIMFGIIATAAYSLFREQGRISRAQQSILDMQSNGRSALNLLSQSFTHAGFGSSDTNPEFLYLENTNPDKATIRYGHKHVATVNTAITSNATDLIDYTVESGESLSNSDNISIYPSLYPNTTYAVDSVGPPLEIEEKIALVPEDAKIYRVFPVEFYTRDNVLYLKDSAGESPIVHNIAAFHVAYRGKGSSTWSEGTVGGSWINNPTAAYIYFILHTNEIEPGFKQGNSFRLPWNNATAISATQDGYHYQSFQTIVWIHNAN